MKLRLTLLNLIALSLLFQGPQAYCQSDGHGAAPILSNPIPCLTNEQRAEIKSLLREQSRAYSTSFTEVDVYFQWPVRQSINFDEWEPTGISNYVDLDPFYPNQILDYACGDRTYDTQAGYNHQGTDIFAWPFPWRKMDHGQLEAVAAAPGKIIYKQGVNWDKSCTFNSNAWNAVYIEHADGSVAWYGHLRTNSLTKKNVGATVEAGEFLGIMGSSGNSSGPHLHFEVYDKDGHLIDPYLGECNTTTDRSWWEVQPEYYQTRLSNLVTHSNPPGFGCYEDEHTNMEVNFKNGTVVYFATYFRDQLSGVTSNHKLIQPDGNTYTSWQTTPSQFYAASYWYRSFSMPNKPGKWTFQVEYEGETREQYFYVYNTEADSRLELSVDTIRFDGVAAGTSATATFEITNVGTGGVLIEGIDYPAGFSGSWDGRIYDSESKTITLTFTPPIDDIFQGNLELITSAEGTRTIYLIGKTDVEITKLLSAESPIDFGALTIHKKAVIKAAISNDGNSDLNISAIAYPEGFTGPDKLTVSAGGSQLLAITFSPEEVKEYAGEIVFTSNATTPASSITVSGTGAALLGIPSTQHSVYPNPNGTGFLFAAENVREISCFSVAGQLIAHWFVTDSGVDISALKPGIYLLSLKSDQTLTREKLIVE